MKHHTSVKQSKHLLEVIPKEPIWNLQEEKSMW